MELEQLMARARHRAHYKQAQERRRVARQQQQTQGLVRKSSQKQEASILKFAAAPAARVSAQGTQLLLPDSVLDMVMAGLAACLEPGGVYGPSLVARDLANASLVCSEFYCAAQFGFSALNNTIQQTLQQQLLRQPLPPPPSPYLGDKARQAHNTAAALSTGCNLPGSESWHFWDVLVTDPLSIQITDLEAAARQMGIVDVALPAPPAAAAVSPGAAAHVQAVATAAEASAAGAAAAVATSSNSRNSSSKHRARLISKLLACFGLKQPLPVIATAATATVPPNDTLQRLAGQNAAAAAAAADTSRATTANATPSSCAAAAAAEPQPCRINGRAALLRAVTLERCCPIIAGDGPDKCAGLLAAVQELSELGYKPAAHAQMYNGLRGCLANVRTELAAAGIGSREALLQLLQQQRDAAAVKRQQQRQQQGRAGLGKRPAGAVVAAALNGAAAKRAKGFSLSSVSIRPKEKQHAFCD